MTVQTYSVVNRVIRVIHYQTNQVVVERPALFSLFRLVNNRWNRVRVISYPYPQAMKVWHEFVNCHPKEYSIRAVNPDFLEAR